MGSRTSRDARTGAARATREHGGDCGDVFFVGDATAPPHPLGWRYVGRGGGGSCSVGRWLWVGGGFDLGGAFGCLVFEWYVVAIAKEETLAHWPRKRTK